MEKEFEKNNPSVVEEKRAHSGRKSLFVLSAVFFIVSGIVAAIYLWEANGRIYIEKCQIEADSIGLSSSVSGRLNTLFVSDGDVVTENQPVAQVGNDIVKSKLAGIIISSPKNIGANFSAGEAVVTMIDPKSFRLDAQLEEDKGLSAVVVGQKVFFTIDAYGAKKYYGVVDAVSPTARTTDVVFNISSQREEQNFDIKIRFDTASYPEIKNGMSGKAWIYKD